jgi:hypothetical protein
MSSSSWYTLGITTNIFAIIVFLGTAIGVTVAIISLNAGLSLIEGIVISSGLMTTCMLTARLITEYIKEEIEKLNPPRK